MADNFDKIINDFFASIGELSPVGFGPQGEFGVKIPAKYTDQGVEVNPMDVGIASLGSGGFGQVKQTGKILVDDALEEAHTLMLRNPELAVVSKQQAAQMASKGQIPSWLLKLAVSSGVGAFLLSQWFGADNLPFYVQQIASKAAEDYENGLISREEAQSRIGTAEEISKLLNINIIFPGVKEGTKELLEGARQKIEGRTFKERAIETAVDVQKAKDEQFNLDREDEELATEELAAANEFVREKYGVSPTEAQRLLRTNPKIVSEYKSSLMGDVIKGRRAQERERYMAKKQEKKDSIMASVLGAQTGMPGATLPSPSTAGLVPALDIPEKRRKLTAKEQELIMKAKTGVPR